MARHRRSSLYGRGIVNFPDSYSLRSYIPLRSSLVGLRLWSDNVNWNSCIPGTLLHSPSRNMHTNFLLNCFVLSVDFGTKKPSKTLISFKICPIPRAIVTIYWIQSHSKCCKAHSIMRKCKLLNTNYNYSPCPLSLEVKKAGYNAPHIFSSPSPDSAELLAVDLLINNFTWFRIATRAKNSHIFHLCH